MGYKSFQIFVDSPTGSYYAGSNVTGRIVLVLEKPKKVRGMKFVNCHSIICFWSNAITHVSFNLGLQIKFIGSGSVSWGDNESVRQTDGTTKTELINYSAEEEYFSNKYYLTGSDSGKCL